MLVIQRPTVEPVEEADGNIQRFGGGGHGWRPDAGVPRPERASPV